MLLKPIITEHSLREAAKGRFSFAVSKLDTRPVIKKEIEKTFGVTVTRILTAAIPHRTYRSGKSRAERSTTRGKKAIVMLAKGQKIDLFEVTDA